MGVRHGRESRQAGTYAQSGQEQMNSDGGNRASQNCTPTQGVMKAAITWGLNCFRSYRDQWFTSHILRSSLNGEWLSAGDKSGVIYPCLLYTSPSPRDGLLSRMP